MCPGDPRLKTWRTRLDLAYIPLKDWPEVSREASDIAKLAGKSPIGLDLEWDSRGRPTLLGLSDGQLHISVPYQDGRDRFLSILTSYPTTVLVGHNIVGADLFVLEQAGVSLPLSQIEDTIIRHWLVNMHLSKSSGKSALEEDADEKRGRGFNNLWTMASLYTNFPHWKDCRDEAIQKPGKSTPAPKSCSGPCPIHDEPGYNGLDAAAPVIALPQLKRTMLLRGIEKLYPMHRELAWRLSQIRDWGVKIDVPYVAQLRTEFEHDKNEIAETLPFNPDSDKQVKEFFSTKYEIELENNQEQTIRDVVEELGEEAPDELVQLQEYKELGNGPDRWFKPQYKDKRGYVKGFMDEAGYVHPHLGFYTSSARLMCSSPNLQNVAKRRKSRKKCECGHLRLDHGSDGCRLVGCLGKIGHKFTGESIGKKVRRAIIAPEGYYIVRADLSNAENRVVLYLSGYQIDRETDLHEWVKNMAGLTDDMEFAQALGNAREAAKSIQHAGNILEGIQLKSRNELLKPKFVAEVKAGARVTYPEWTFRGKQVTFTGSNLARRAFGDASLPNRKKALEIAGKYFDRFPGVRDFQKRVSKQVETENVIRPPNGYVLLSYGQDVDQMKQAQGTWQQQPVAHVTKLALLRAMDRWDRDGLQRPVLQVHDELICYVKDSVAPDQAMKWIQEDMEVEQPVDMPNFIIPAEPSYGPNWRDQKKGKL